LILSAVMMLRHIGEFDAAAAIEHAVIVTLEEGKALTRDVVGDTNAAGTSAYTNAIIDNLGRTSSNWAVRDDKPIALPKVPSAPDMVKAAGRKVVGAEVVVESGLQAEALGQSLETLVADAPVRLKMISSRGTKVYPPMGR
jgi:isocitrate dehydrogenase